MHGIIYIGMKSFVLAKHGDKAWASILEKAGLADKIFYKDKIYPDGEAVSIVKAAAELTGASAEDVMEGFGKFLAPSLMMLYREKVDPTWRTMGMLMHVEGNIHATVRKEMPDADPPKLQFEKISENEVKLYYNSPRCMSAVAKGLIQGVAHYYNEEVVLSEKKLPEGGVEILVAI